MSPKSDLTFFMRPPNMVLLEAWWFCLVCLCVRPSVCACVCVCPETLTQYLAAYLTHFHQTYIIDASWDRDECVKFWGQKIKGQGHGGIMYAGTISSRTHTVLELRLSSFLLSFGWCTVAVAWLWDRQLQSLNSSKFLIRLIVLDMLSAAVVVQIFCWKLYRDRLMAVFLICMV